ncbi:MAG: tetratricopeptide repeat protein [Chloroflexia bacterium]|nr:tetratricopeptide repeat protein [Chloroflexia bacterium]
MACLALRLLGPPQVVLEDDSNADFPTDKVRALLYYLAVEAGSPHRRDALVGLLWPDLRQARARQNLRQALSYLRQSIAELEFPRPLLQSSRETISLEAQAGYVCDVAEFGRLVQECHEHSHRRLGSCRACLQRMQRAADLYRGPFLEGFYLSDSAIFEEWLLLKREWLQRQAMEALSLLTDFYIRRGEYEQAFKYVWKAVDLEPWREELQRQLMRLLAIQGQRSAALSQYASCRQVLQDVLGVEPTDETTALYDQIRASEPVGPALALSKLPPLPTSFVGREDELAELSGLLSSPECRLLTLVGPGGVGKTRLALEAAAQQVGCFADGVFFVPLGDLASLDLLVPVIASVLGISFQVRQDPRVQLLNYLAQREILLLLDNLEHLLAGADLLADILRRAPNLVLLLTSRERLNLREEWVYEVYGLSYPQNERMEGLTLDVLEGHSASKLFLQRAQQTTHSFRCTEEQIPHVIRICSLVEGMPLAIELAAAWVGMRSCQELAEEIERNLDILTTHLRNVHPRHGSMRAALEHSWGLLGEHEQELFAALSIFRGGFDLAAAKGVLEASPAHLADLLGKSLLLREISGRYRLHQLLRQYAEEKLDGQPLRREELSRRHAGYYAAWLQQQEANLRGSGQGPTMEKIRAEVGNVRKIWRWALAGLERGLDEALPLIELSMDSLYLFYGMQSWYQEGEAVFAQAARLLQQRGPLSGREERLLGKLLAYQGKCCEFTECSDKAERLFERSIELLQRQDAWRETALPLHGLGYTAHIQGDYGRARESLQRSLEVCRRAQDPWGEANALSNLCLVARRQGNFAEACSFGEESLAIRRQVGDQQGMASSSNNLGLVYCDLGDYARARQVLEEGLRICRELDYRVGLANAVTGLCQAHFRLGDISAAERYGRESLQVYQDVGDQWGVAIAYNNLGRMAAEQGDLVRALPLYRQAISLYRRLAIQSGLSNTLANLGEVCAELEQYEQACQYLREALQVACEIGSMPAALKTLVLLASLLARRGQHDGGLTLLAFALAQPALAQEVRQQAGRLRAELLAGLLPEQAAAAEQRGRGLNWEEIRQWLEV